MVNSKALSIALVPIRISKDSFSLPDVKEAERIAITNRTDLQASLASIEAAEARMRKAKSSSLPQVSLVGLGDLYGTDPLTDEGSWAVLARARMNLYSGGANKTRLSAARYDKMRLESERENQVSILLCVLIG